MVFVVFLILVWRRVRGAVQDEKNRVAERRNIEKFIQSDN